MKFVAMKRPLEHPAIRNGKVLIPAGATGVKIAFRQSPFTFFNEKTQRRQHLDVYIWKNRMYNA